jgi:predicted negative regulator of RcsB-dependent stress response
MTRQELKHDEMEDLGHKMNEWFERNSNWLSILIIVTALGFVGYKGYGWWQQKEHSEAAADLRSVYTNMSGALNAKEEKDRTEAFTKAVSEAERVAATRSSSPVGRAAQLALGNIHYQRATSFGIASADDFRKELKSAEDAFQRYISMAQTAEEKAVGQLALGNVLENQLLVADDPKSLSSDAEKAYKEAADLSPGTYVGSEAVLARARLIANQAGRTEEARQLLDGIAKARKLPEVKPDDMPRPVKTAQGGEISSEELNNIRTFADFSIAHEAERLSKMLNALPGIPQK